MQRDEHLTLYVPDRHRSLIRAKRGLAPLILLPAMRRGPFLFLFAVSGAAALIYEVVWTRLLTLHMGHGLAAASTVLAAFMGGLAAGAGAAGRYAGTLPPRRALTTYAVLELAVGVLALLMPLALIAVRPLLAATYADGDGGSTFAFVRLATSVLLLCVPAACMGATFPIASRWMVRTARERRQDAGGLYAANTLGAAAGAILAGFVLIPALGLARHDLGRRGAERDRGRRRVADRAQDARSWNSGRRQAAGIRNRRDGRQRQDPGRRRSRSRSRSAIPWLAAARARRRAGLHR